MVMRSACYKIAYPKDWLLVLDRWFFDNLGNQVKKAKQLEACHSIGVHPEWRL